MNPLPRLLALRRIEILAQAAVLALAVWWLRIPLEVAPMATVIALLALVNLVSQWRLDQGAKAEPREVFVHLSIDVLALGALLYFAGGSTNPFVSLFLLPPTLAAAMLPASSAWAMAGLTLLTYTLLVFWKLPLPLPQGDLAQFDQLLARATGEAGEHAAHGSGFALHVLGMWLNFVLSLAVVGFFLTRMASALKERERELAAAREAALRNEQILSLGTLAAGAAHQLGTPLATMAVVIRELALNHRENPELHDDLRVLREQVDRCKQTISQMLASTGRARDESLRSQPVASHLCQIVEQWQVMRPRALLRLLLPDASPAPQIATDRTLEQAIINLLDNAADAHDEDREPVIVSLGWDSATCCIEIVDQGPGISAAKGALRPQPFVSNKTTSNERPGGIGIGLFLSSATIERFGGRVELGNRSDGQRGACTRILLPLVEQRS